jgi:hypothetical protein
MQKAQNNLPPFFWVSYEKTGAEKALSGKVIAIAASNLSLFSLIRSLSKPFIV